jgi:hypothetical protein
MHTQNAWHAVRREEPAISLQNLLPNIANIKDIV